MEFLGLQISLSRGGSPITSLIMAASALCASHAIAQDLPILQVTTSSRLLKS